MGKLLILVAVMGALLLTARLTGTTPCQWMGACTWSQADGDDAAAANPMLMDTPDVPEAPDAAKAADGVDATPKSDTATPAASTGLPAEARDTN